MFAFQDEPKTTSERAAQLMEADRVMLQRRQTCPTCGAEPGHLSDEELAEVDLPWWQVCCSH